MVLELDLLTWLIKVDELVSIVLLVLESGVVVEACVISVVRVGEFVRASAGYVFSLLSLFVQGEVGALCRPAPSHWCDIGPAEEDEEALT